MNSKGFTLIESLIYIAIIGGVIGAFVGFALTISDSRNKTYVGEEVQANTRVALGIMTQYVQSADDINMASSTFDSDPGVLSLSMTSSTIDPTVFSLDTDDGTLYMTQGSASPVAITSDEVRVTNLIFTDLTGDSKRGHVSIDMTIDFTSTTDAIFSYSQDIETSVSVRK